MRQKASNKGKRKKKEIQNGSALRKGGRDERANKNENIKETERKEGRKVRKSRRNEGTKTK